MAVQDSQVRTPDPKYALLAAQLAKSHAETLAWKAQIEADTERLDHAQQGKCAICTEDHASILDVDRLICYGCSQAQMLGANRLRLVIAGLRQK